MDLSALSQMKRGDVVLETDLTYDGVTPVLVRATKRDGRFEFSDQGGAVATAGIDRQGVRFPNSIDVGDYTVNVSRHGVVWLPAVEHSGDAWLSKLPELVAEGSRSLYAALLDTQD